MFIKSLNIFALLVCGTCYSQDKNDTMLEQTVYGSPIFWNMAKKHCQFFTNSYSNGQPFNEFEYNEDNYPVSYTTYFYNGDTAMVNNLNELSVIRDTVPLPSGVSKYQSSDTFQVHTSMKFDAESISFYSNKRIRQYTSKSAMSEISFGYNDNGALIYSKIIVGQDTTSGLFHVNNSLRNDFDKLPETFYVLKYYHNGKITNFIEVTFDRSISRILDSKLKVITSNKLVDFFDKRVCFLLNYGCN